MDLRLCPGCGQSVLDDDAGTCPFCGGAMDGSSTGTGSKKTAPPARPASPVKPGISGSPASPPQPPATGAPAKRPGLKPRTDRPQPNSADKEGTPASAAAETPPSTGTPSKPSSAVQAGIRAAKPIVDEDDPFGIGPSIPAEQAIPVLAKPEKGKLHKVVCPMCDQAGFIGKSAIGKSVRCANPKCIVPVFTAPDPDAPPVDKIPRRRATPDADVDKKPEGIALRRNPMMMYGIVAVVLLGLGFGVVQFLSAPPKVPDGLTDKIPTPEGGYGNPTEEEVAAAAAEAAKKQAALAASNPSVEAERLVKRMIQAARQPTNRDKSFARRMTGDVYLRLGQPKLAAQEFAQMVSNDAKTVYYQIEPRLNDYWRKRKAGDAAGAKAQFAQIMKDSQTAPLGGSMALESAIGIAAVLVAENKTGDATTVVDRYQRDRSVPARRDSMTASAYFLTSSRLQEAKLIPFKVGEVFGWHDPLRTTVAVDLASHGLWNEAIQWSGGGADLQEKSDSLAAIAEVATMAKAPADILQSIEAAAANANPMVGLRIRSVLAGNLKSAERLAAVEADFAAIPSPEPMTLPSAAEILQLNLSGIDAPVLTASAVTEYARAAAMCGDSAKADAGVRKLSAILLSLAPPTAGTRVASSEIESSEDSVKRRIAAEMRLATDSQITSTFRNYRRKVDQLAAAAESRRLMLTMKLGRVVRGGGVEPIQSLLADPASGLKAELMTDDLCGLLAAAAIQAGKEFPECAKPDTSLQVAKPGRVAEQHELTIAPKIAVGWLMAQQGRLANAVRIIEPGIDLPGLREAAINELLLFHIRKTPGKPESVYAAIGQISNPAWRENLLQSIGLLAVRGSAEKSAEAWIDSQSRMPPTEQVTALYGLAVGIAERIEPAKPVAAAGKK